MLIKLFETHFRETGRNLKRLEVEDSSVTMSSDTDVSLSSFDEDQGSKLTLKAHCLSPLEWQVWQQLLHMDYID